MCICCVYVAVSRCILSSHTHGHLQVRRILHYQLPPRGFWTWWCGGLAVYDALVVAAWVAINVIYTQQRVALILPLFKRKGLLPIMA